MGIFPLRFWIAPARLHAPAISVRRSGDQARPPQPAGQRGMNPLTCFMIFCISLNCFRRRFTSATGLPLPLAMRARREPLRISGFVALLRGHGEDDRLHVLHPPEDRRSPGGAWNPSRG